MKSKQTLSIVGGIAIVAAIYAASEYWKVPTDLFLWVALAGMWMRYESRIETLSNHLAVVERTFDEMFPDECNFSNPALQRPF